jgi:hypothetical protein
MKPHATDPLSMRAHRMRAWCAFVALGACCMAVHGQPSGASDAQRAAFQKYNSCPSTGRRTGECPGYRIAYRVALCAGGQDRWTNMVWLSEPAAREKVRGDAAACAARGVK